MPPKFYTSILKERKHLTKDVFEIAFELKNTENMDFKAGQFVNIRVDDGNKKMLFRSYSIMSPPSQKNEIRSCIKIIPEGRCSPWLEKASIGTPITFMGPVGMFTFKEGQKKDVLFVATGTGITPLYSMVLDQLEKGNAGKMHLLWGFRYEEDVFYKDFFEGLAKKYQNFTFTLTISRPTENWKGEKGRVTDYLEKNFPDPQNTEVYICGVGEMVLDVKNLCIKKGMPAEAVHFERYT